MTDRTPENYWDSIETDLPEPGMTPDPAHGIEGDPEPLPEDDAEREEDMT